MKRIVAIPGSVVLLAVLLAAHLASAAQGQSADDTWAKITPFFTPPAEYQNDFGDFRSPLLFNDGRKVETAADWPKRRQEILETWHGLMGQWPPLFEKPSVEYLEKETRDSITQHKVRIGVAPGRSTDGYILLPAGAGPFPAVVVVYYEPESSIGRKEPLRDFGWQLAQRGFVTLQIGTPGGSFYYPSEEDSAPQPLSLHAYVAANCYNVLANLPSVDARRVGIVGHSYGGKWAMFASCLYDKFACAAWSDGGIVFDESRPNVNYWEPWYLGFERGPKRKRGVPTDASPRTGAYKKMIEQGRDLHELHALMAPRPFLVSGGSEDRPEQWRALHHTIAVNRLLGHENRVAMTNREGHTPTPESNEQIYLFFEHFLKPKPAAEGAR